jgi:hypothetical protein
VALVSVWLSSTLQNWHLKPLIPQHINSPFFKLSMAYDRDIVVGCNKRHYDLLIRMAYLDPAAVRHPPPEGWSDDQLAVDVLQYSNRSDAVIDLLQHLPYNVRNTGMVKFEVYIATENTCFLLDMGYPKGTTAEKRRNTDLTDYLLMPYGAVYPPGFIALSQGNDEVEWMVDTEEGKKATLTLNISDIIFPLTSRNRNHLARRTFPCE